MDSELLFLIGLLGAIVVAIFFLTRKEDPKQATQNLRDAVNNVDRPGTVQQQQEEPKPMTKKDILKEQKKERKRQEKEGRKQQVASMLQKQQEELEESLKRQKKQEEKENERERYEKELEEEQKRKEEEEYNKWVGDIQEVDTGNLMEDEASKESMLETFINYLKLRKVVPLDELGANFKLSTKDVIKRIKQLEEQELITGVIDDRGKYIFIKKEELIKIKEMIIRKGRITKTDLVTEVSRIVSLEPSPEDRLKIEEEEKKLLATVNKQLTEMNNN